MTVSSRAVTASLLVLATLALPARAAAQDALSKEAAAAIKAAFVADIEGMSKKVIGLAEAFPQDKYSYRPMEGVRSVSEVLMLFVNEAYSFAPTSLGGKPGLPREEAQKLSSVTDKAQVIDHLNKAFAYAKKELESIDPATLTGPRKLFGQERNTAAVVQLVGGDMHEHLGQLIAYARANKVVPPWSK